jgi:Raf kinase inhibitor-like YbhB/YbcL family protein
MPRALPIVLVDLGCVFVLAAAVNLSAQNPPTQTSPPQNPPLGGRAGQGATNPLAQNPQTPAQPGGQRGGGGRGRGSVPVMSFNTTAWVDGGVIPVRYSQAGEEHSPPLSWGDAPATTKSFVLVVRDIDAANNTGTGDFLHWLVWNIPGESRALPEGFPQGPQLPNGTRQISATGPYYRGPAAPSTTPAHHYVFELYALDTMLDVPSVGASPADTRTAIATAMAGHVVGRGTIVGRFKRPEA